MHMKDARSLHLARVLALSAALLPAPAVSRAAGCDWVGWDWLSQKCEYAGKAWRSGSYDLFLTGYADHRRGTYTAERRAELNAHSWGGGFGRTLNDERDNSHDVFFLIFRDSHFKPEYLAGYGWQARWPLTENLKVGIGLTAFVTLRSDFSHYLLPVPAVLPLASVRYRRVTLQSAYVPKLPGAKGNGDVLFVFGKYAFD
jgi:lipid IVA palmitoyltransferase